jgi:molecular chaperone DnaJ
VKGRGVETKKGHGDLLVTVQVAVPTRLTTEQREAVEALADVLPAASREHLGV